MKGCIRDLEIVTSEAEQFRHLKANVSSGICCCCMRILHSWLFLELKMSVMKLKADWSRLVVAVDECGV